MFLDPFYRLRSLPFVLIFLALFVRPSSLKFVVSKPLMFMRNRYFAGYVESDDEDVYDDEPEGDESEDIEESEEEKPKPSKKAKKN